MGRKLTDSTTVVNPNTGAAEFLEAGSEAPDWAADLLGDHLFDADAADDGGDDLPPESGRGSGLGAWTDYASDHNIEIPEDIAKDKAAVVEHVKAARAAQS